MAVDTKDGLIVPVIHSTDLLSVEEIAAKIIELSEKAKIKNYFKNIYLGQPLLFQV